ATDGNLHIVFAVLKKMEKLFPIGHPEHIIMTGSGGNQGALDGIREGYVDQSSSHPWTDLGIIADWIERRFNGQEIHAETITNPNALWSPAHMKKTDMGWLLVFSTVSVNKDNVDDKRLWANQIERHFE
ncbi:MAG: hypothetical protein KAJ75_09370, partial [Alphaproteobacteria bacterium]|nr:hypothetical protein [Alphaproteobacteria bacterium]